MPASDPVISGCYHRINAETLMKRAVSAKAVSAPTTWVRTHHIEPCADASGPPRGDQSATRSQGGGGRRARPCLRRFPPASLPFNATAPFRANPLFYLERARGFEPPTPTLARLCSTPELHPHRVWRSLRP